MTTGSVLAQFTITLSQAVSEQVAVEWHTADGTALAGVDYAAAKGTVLFAPGQTAKTVDILVYGRAVGSEDRSFFIEMLPPVNAILGASIGECIIHVDTTGSTPVIQIIVPTGPQGPEGDSAYQTWLDLGNTGTEQDFIDSLSDDTFDRVKAAINAVDGVLTSIAEETPIPEHSDPDIGAALNAQSQALANRMLWLLDTANWGFVRSADFSEYIMQGQLDRADVHGVKVQAGEYNISGSTLTIKGKNQIAPIRGEYVLDMTGVSLTGTGTIVVDSCKRIRIKGLRAPNWDIDLRGCWWSVFDNCQYRRTYTGRAGTYFSDSYWNMWVGGVTQAVVIPDDAVGPSNRYLWQNHSMRGNAQQGFSGTETHAFHYLGNQNAQNWVFDGDISYHTTGVIDAPVANTADIELDFNVYWDSVIPQATSRKNMRIINRGHHANGSGTYMPMSSAMKNRVDVLRRDRVLTNTPASSLNMVLNGDFRDNLGTSWVGSNAPFSYVGGATLTWVKGGLSGGYLQVSQPNASNNSITAVGRNKQYGGPYSVVWVVRNRDVGERDIRVSIGESVGLNYVTAKINDNEPTVITLSVNDIPSGSGNVFSSLFADGAGFNVDIIYVGISMGIQAPLMLPSIPRMEIYIQATSTGLTVPAGGRIIESFSISGVVVGDLILVSAVTGSIWVRARVVGAGQVHVMWESTGTSDFPTAGINLLFIIKKQLLGS